ncbi:MAG: seryl-tRNA synthetase [Parcubacteria group bacterium Greene0416_79]|nr:MAG: seryl-tRNA synthetase [Parcubacteria group bacterium Greene0416_79]
MLDIKFIREHKELIAMAAKKKHLEFKVEDLIALDDARRGLLSVVEAKRAEQNRRSEEVARCADEAKRRFLLEELRAFKAALEEEEKKLKTLLPKWQALMLAAPNIPDVSVPEGKDSSDNIELRTGGVAPQFDFAPRGHIELLEKADALDLAKGGAVSGFRGYFLKNDGALLSFALWQFALDRFLGKKDFIPMIVPSLVRRETLLGTGYLPQSEDDLYKTR